ncbi:hypothetical protein FACS1894217_10840 [Clostridia bacterium]|nr:hypothetical protein FACS1894217_10840 [Clostridia bacterium]
MRISSKAFFAAIIAFIALTPVYYVAWRFMLNFLPLILVVGLLVIALVVGGIASIVEHKRGVTLRDKLREFRPSSALFLASFLLFDSLLGSAIMLTLIGSLFQLSFLTLLIGIVLGILSLGAIAALILAVRAACKERKAGAEGRKFFHRLKILAVGLVLAQLPSFLFGVALLLANIGWGMDGPNLSWLSFMFEAPYAIASFAVIAGGLIFRFWRTPAKGEITDGIA